MKNYEKQTPLDVAHEHGYELLATTLEQFEQKRKQNDPPQLLFSSSPFINNNNSNSNATSMSQTSPTTTTISNTTTTTDCGLNLFNTSNYDDNNDLSSLLSSTTCPPQDDCDSLDHAGSAAVAAAADYLDNVSPKSVESQQSTRSHDGVFLRPVSVSGGSIQSPPATNSNSIQSRLFKRTSIDSGINMDANPSLRSFFRANNKFMRDVHSKLSRADRSMSLPVANSTLTAFSKNPSMGSSASTHDTIADCFSLSIDSALDPVSFCSSTATSNASLLSPIRKMDFALCKYSNAWCYCTHISCFSFSISLYFFFF